MKQILIFAIILTLCPSFSMARTHLYKRVMIIEHNSRRTVNDDAHYVTFTDKGLYQSDKDGYGITGSNLIPFEGLNGELRCYIGVTYFGHANIYVNSDYSRINLRLGDVVYVYQIENNLTTNASFRPERNLRNYSPEIHTPNNSQTDSYHIQTPSETKNKESRYGWISCPLCHGSGKCSTCSGSGSASGYGNSFQCVNCLGYTTGLAADWGKCRKCNGKGKIYGLK